MTMPNKCAAAKLPVLVPRTVRESWFAIIGADPARCGRRSRQGHSSSALRKFSFSSDFAHRLLDRVRDRNTVPAVINAEMRESTRAARARRWACLSTTSRKWSWKAIAATSNRPDPTARSMSSPGAPAGGRIETSSSDVHGLAAHGLRCPRHRHLARPVPARENGDIDE